jgi:hypothetical protein
MSDGLGCDDTTASGEPASDIFHNSRIKSRDVL